MACPPADHRRYALPWGEVIYPPWLRLDQRRINRQTLQTASAVDPGEYRIQRDETGRDVGGEQVVVLKEAERNADSVAFTSPCEVDAGEKH